MPYVAATPYEKDIQCLTCGKIRTVIVINKVPKTCCDECRIKRNEELQVIWKAKNPQRIQEYRAKLKADLQRNGNKYYHSKKYMDDEPQSLLIR